MKYLILALLFAAPVHADTQLEKCGLIGQFAEAAMELRQGGVPLSTALEPFEDFEPGQAIIKLAYDTPRFHSRSSVQRAVEDFRNDVERVCFE